VRGFALLATLTLVVAACSDDEAPAVSPQSQSSSVATPTTTTSTTTLPPEALQALVDDFVDSQDVVFSVVVVDLATGASASHLSGRQVRAASL
jgi:ABC-type glycerol-3-phosphate transport system substrate-binding protein